MPNSDELFALVKKQSEMIADLQQDSKKIKRRLFFMAFGSYLRLFIILVPLILALVYVVPFLKDNWKSMQSILSISGMAPRQPGTPSFLDQLNAQGIDVAQVLQQLQKR